MILNVATIVGWIAALADAIKAIVQGAGKDGIIDQLVAVRADMGGLLDTLDADWREIEEKHRVVAEVAARDGGPK